MKTKAQELRELRNEILYNDKQPLDKQVSWGEILRMLKKNDKQSNYMIDDLGWLSHIDREATPQHIRMIQFDLTHSPEEQDLEVIEKLVELLNNK